MNRTIRTLILAAFAGLTLAASAFAQAPQGEPVVLPLVEGIAGRWEGTLNTQGITLRIVFRVIETEDGTTVFMDSPDQLAIGIPVTGIARDGSEVIF
jgi:hypothetical protein